MFTFKKEERLSSRKTIKNLYESGKPFSSKCFRVIWGIHSFESSYPVQLLISVSKKNFKRAVDRNRIKRLIREAYRKQKEIIYEPLKIKDKKIALVLNYTAKEELSYNEIENKIIVTLQRLQLEFEKDN